MELSHVLSFSISFLPVFRVLSLLIAFFHVTNFAAFLSGTSLCCCTTSATDLREFLLLSCLFHLTLLPHICHSTASATDLREPFFTLRHVLPSTPTRNLAQSAFIKASLGAGSFPLRLQGLPLRFKTQTKSIFCLNRTVFSRSYQSVGFVYVLRSYRTLYQPLSGFEPTLY